MPGRMRVRPLSDEEADRVRDLVPERGDVPVEEGDGVTLVLEKDLGPVSSRLRALLGGSETVRYELDERGQAVWGWIDGRRSVEEIADRFADEFDDAAALARVWTFLRMLADRDAVRLRA